ncbi:hypothetical protein RRG08_035777 [Elysia crispata]|uniref:Uncharacterized protein n=1 Tax=Elysia crispata TaxID=231223 RepID=A0AAE1DIG3_9GAST|nr:hypothetical protein RRG08_035777 [Elysia crispata]
MSYVRDGQIQSSVADSGLEGSAVDQLITEASSNQTAFGEDTAGGKAKKPTAMSTNELEGAPARSAADRRGSDDSDDGREEERRGSEDSLAAEGISMEKQDVETKEKQASLDKRPVGESGRGGYSVVGGTGSSGVRQVSPEGSGSTGRSEVKLPDRKDKSSDASSEEAAGRAVRTPSTGHQNQDGTDDANQELPFVAPITLEVGQVMFAPAPPPVSTAMPVMRSRSRDDEGAAEEIQDNVVEDNEEQYFDAVQEKSVRDPEKDGEYRASKRRYNTADDADDEHVSSVSEGEDNDIEGGKADHLVEDETFPLRTYKTGRFRADENPDAAFRDRLAERRHRLSSTSSAGLDDGASSVVSDVYSPRPHRPPLDKNIGASEADERAAQSYKRFKASMPKFSSKAYSFSKRQPTSVAASNTTQTLSFDHSPLLSPGSALPSTKETSEIVYNGGTEPQDSNQTLAGTTSRFPYDEIKVDKSEGYYLDNYTDVCTWRLPTRELPRLYMDGALDLALEDLLEKVEADETGSQAKLLEQDSDNEETAEGEKREEGEGEEIDNDVEKTEVEAKNKEDEHATEKPGEGLPDKDLDRFHIGEVLLNLKSIQCYGTGTLSQAKPHQETMVTDLGPKTAPYAPSMRTETMEAIKQPRGGLGRPGASDDQRTNRVDTTQP